MTQLENAASQWPDFRVNVTAFSERLAALEAKHDALSAPLNVSDLYLTQGCLEGHASAHRALGHLLSEQLNNLSQFKLSAAEKSEVHQGVMTSLLVSKDSQTPPKIEHYSGKGALAAWLQMTLIRSVLDRLRKEKREVPMDDEWLLGRASDGVDLDLYVLKQRYAGQFSEAFRRAIRKLSSRQRNLLRQHHLDGLTFEELGSLYRVHRSTAANWLTVAKNDLLMHTRDEISELTGLPRLAVDSLMRLVQSQLDISTGVFLSAETPAKQRAHP